MSKATKCPLCGASAYTWLTLPAPGEKATVGLISPVDPDAPDPTREHIVERCTECGAGILIGHGKVDLEEELRAVTSAESGGTLAIEAPNRASLQAGIGGEGWAALADWNTRLLLTPRAVELLAEKQGYEVARTRFQLWGRSQRWMWQTLLNGLTLHPNFLHEVRAGRLRIANSRGPFAFVADFVASVLAAPFVALVSFPLELIAIVLGRGGLIVAEAKRR
jgi:hypothetical protein